MVVLSLSVAFAPRRAHAQTSLEGPEAAPRSTREREARIAELKKRGDELLDKKRYAEALTLYDEAYALAPSALLLYNRGRALEFLGRFPEALEAIERFATEAPLSLRDRVRGLPELLERLRARVGVMVVTSPVPGARVLIDAKQVGVTPLAQPLRVTAGRLSVEVFAEGYFPMRRVVDVPARGTERVDFALVSRDTSALLMVRGHVPGMRVSIDGQAAGVAPVEAGLLAGKHVVVAEREGFDPASANVLLGAGEKREMWVDPIARPALYTRWWFWSAIGVVVVGGVVTYIALTTDRPTPSGDYSPGLVRF